LIVETRKGKLRVHREAYGTTGQDSTNENWDKNKIERQRETQNDKRDKNMTTRDNILKFVIFLSLVVIFLSCLSFCVSLCLSILFLSQFLFVLSCPVYGTIFWH
jgi:uncharacterized membrane protein